MERLDDWWNEDKMQDLVHISKTYVFKGARKGAQGARILKLECECGIIEAGKKIEVETVDAGSAKRPARSSHQYWLNCWYHKVSEGGNTELVSGRINLDDWSDEEVESMLQIDSSPERSSKIIRSMAKNVSNINGHAEWEEKYCNAAISSLSHHGKKHS
ncbi:hypothetical protein MKW98_018251 [Papaver atlanticum]|uniref:Uncharacterized protein n=1 Tax=Papaver atlanticum TaxID=357466 RepID=A0AAD4X7P1_9MAGN|nr:hypothetical protein MKW98_018251 [Papaver atlanticum]